MRIGARLREQNVCFVLIFLLALSLSVMNVSAGKDLGSDHPSVRRVSSASTFECEDWSSAHPEWLWCDDFEDGFSLEDKYEDYNTTAGGMTISADDSFSGLYSLRQHYEPSQVNAGWIWKMFGRNPYTGSQGPLYREIYVRWYHKFEDGFEGIPPKMARLRVFSPEHWQGAHTTHFWLEPSTGEIVIDPVSYVPAGQNYVDPNQARWLGIVETDFSFNVPENIGRWVCFEMKVKLNDAGLRNGEIEYFADGSPIGRSINLDMVGSYSAYGLNGMQWDTYWNAGSPKAQNRYYDNLVISTEPIGCIDSDSTFVDVPPDHPYHDYIEALYQAEYIAGCSVDPLMYCPEQTMTRAESAVFVERGVHGAGYLPAQPAEQIFADVPSWEWFAKWSTGLWNDGYTAGCGTDPLIYCPLQGHTRAEGCVFFLRMLHGVDYVPPDPQGIFVDVPVEYWGAKWIEAAYNAGLIPACATEPDLSFCPDDPLDRAMAAYMMVQAKGITLP